MDDAPLFSQGDGQVNLKGLESGERANALRWLVHFGFADGLSETATAFVSSLKICAISCGMSVNGRSAKPPRRANWGGVRCGQTVCLESLSLSEGEVNLPYFKVRWLSNS